MDVRNLASQNLDYEIFILITLSVFGFVHFWLWKSDRQSQILLLGWSVLVLLLGGGWFFVAQAGHAARNHIRTLVAGFAPTYAADLQAMGHAQITEETPLDDPCYLAMIDAQIRWLKANPRVADIYTIRKLPDGKHVFIVDSETDYDHNEQYEGERESRTDIGEEYEEEDPDLEQALQGHSVFGETATTDRWGTWVSAFEPMFDEAGNVEAVLGVDYEASEWEAAIRQGRFSMMMFLAILVIALLASTTIIAVLRADLRKRAETERLKDELVATVSHELRTPLTSLRGFAELMLKRNYPVEKQREFLAIMQQEATRLTTLINDFLDLQRIESGRQTYQFEYVSLQDLLRQRVTVFSDSGGPHHFTLDIDETLPFIRADKDRLQLVLTNLLSNAVKFSPAGGTIAVGSRPQGHEVLTWVTDQGVGIPPEALPKLFTKFFRVDNQETRRIGGTGLGLALAKKIIEAHGGQIWVESVVGRGSTFFFSFPAVAASEKHAAATQEAA